MSAVTATRPVVKRRAGAPPAPLETTLSRRRLSPLVVAAVLAAVIALGVLIRLEDGLVWRRHPERAFFHSHALLTTFDGYHYLGLARDLSEGRYARLDPQRAVPEGFPRPWPPPLLPVIAATLQRFLPLSLDRIGAVLPPFLGPLLALPVFALGRFYGGSAAGLLAACFVVTAPHYVYRSNLGWFDTDCMNVTWAMLLVWCVLKFGTEQRMRRYAYLAAALAVTILFAWWWDQATAAVAGFLLLPVTVALAVWYRPAKMEWTVFGVASIALALAVWAAGDFPSPVDGWGALSAKLTLLTKREAGAFPNVGASINELYRPGLHELAIKTTGTVPGFVAALAGLILLIVRMPKKSVFLLTPLVMGAMSVVFARRLIIFASPALAVGLGYLLAALWRRARPWPLLAAAVGCAALFLVWLPVQKNVAVTYWPKERPMAVQGMAEAGRLTPAGTLVWAWWDHGYTLKYWSRRGTFNDGDGRINDGERTVYNAIPYAAADQRLAANFMRFMAARGMTGMQALHRAAGSPAGGLRLLRRILAAGPAEVAEILGATPLTPGEPPDGSRSWEAFFFPPESVPVVLLVDRLLVETANWWYWFGSWDPARRQGRHPRVVAYPDLRWEGDRIEGPRSLSVDTVRGVVRTDTVQQLHLAVLNRFDGARVKTRRFGSRGPVLEVNQAARFGALMDPELSQSVFAQLFFRHQYDPRYFQPLRLVPPHYQLWRVNGDRGSQAAAGGSLP